jgi:hypothetical protein
MVRGKVVELWVLAAVFVGADESAAKPFDPIVDVVVERTLFDRATVVWVLRPGVVIVAELATIVVVDTTRGTVDVTRTVVGGALVATRGTVVRGTVVEL